MLVTIIGCKITKKNPNSTKIGSFNAYKDAILPSPKPHTGYCNGSDEQAFGARIRIALATVGAIRSTVAWVVTRPGLTPAPYIIIGNGMKAAREK